MPALLVHLHFSTQYLQSFPFIASHGWKQLSRSIWSLPHDPLSHLSFKLRTQSWQLSLAAHKFCILRFEGQSSGASVPFCSASWPEAGAPRHRCSITSNNNNGGNMLPRNRLPQQSIHRRIEKNEENFLWDEICCDVSEFRDRKVLSLWLGYAVLPKSQRLSLGFFFILPMFCKHSLNCKGQNQ